VPLSSQADASFSFLACDVTIWHILEISYVKLWA